MNIFEALRHDHDKQRSLVDALINTHGESSDRQSIMKDLKNELEEHAKFEERYFYNPLICDDLTQEKARHGIAEHHEIDDLIEKLEDTKMTSSAWLITAKKLHHLVHHHLAEEEHEAFQLAGKVLTDTQKITLAKQYNEAMN
ncbi:hemerythrin [Pseudoalteromonas porphyrae]|uniref:Hemerythrin n=2 Tax=Pseudoalteromonas TaxID=53246 RepID=A0A0N1EAA8_9GAMM|nr:MULTISPECIES: hemerythrin domain-containing protein [Pseudoalteromonas]KPH56762.1 hemerythrin [Pseudoalteromonas porphyrae]KPH92978.1 hemerythrin [Pseudoalteromonas porphyrae]